MTAMYSLKRIIYSRLLAAANGMGPLSTLGVGGGPLQVKYDPSPRDMQARCVYGGPARFENDFDRSIAEGRFEKPIEVISSIWLVRVAEPDLSVEMIDVERVAEQIGDAIEEFLLGDPEHVFRVLRGQSEPDPQEDQNLALLAYEIQLESQ